MPGRQASLLLQKQTAAGGNTLDPENDTGILVTYLSQTIEESKRLREDLTRGRVEGHAPAAQEDAPSAEDASAEASPGQG
jgi:hypothetical protein